MAMRTTVCPFSPAIRPLGAALIALCLAALPAGPALAQAAGPNQQVWSSDAERSQLVERAEALRAHARAMRDESRAKYEAEFTACYQRFRVYACQGDAKKAKTAAELEARKVDAEARELELEIRTRDVASRDARAREEAPRRAASQERQSEEFRADKARQDAEREQRQAEKAKAVETGNAQAAAERRETAARLSAKRADKAAQGVEAAQRAEDQRASVLESRQRMAERDAKVAEKKAEREAKEKQRAAERAKAEADGIIPKKP